MADTKEGREKQADNQERRQRERDLAEAQARRDESEPPDVVREEYTEANGDVFEYSDSPRECHRRGCTERATFLVLERYLEETGHGPVEAVAYLCEAHTDEESPTNLDAAYDDYVFRVTRLPN
ncbi:hypothetical protein ACFQH3_01310 [Haladaptatus sp. GCM10025707]|uniref:hypothetical protein n=1 Tax=unclassified Haladaptatus TaxID=2622732 RepID=UPI0023E79490|nr:hypothetical protein [Haladaptatus sp. QDMS2]